MTQATQIALIIAGVLIILFIIFRRQLKDFVLRLTRDELSAELHTHEPARPAGTSPAASQSPEAPSTSSSVNITGNVQRGKRHTIRTDREANISNNIQRGEDHVIAASDPRIPHLHQYITNNFSINDLRTLSQHLHLNYDTLPGANIDDKTHALLTHTQRQNQLPALITAARQTHPDLPWEDA